MLKSAVKAIGWVLRRQRRVRTAVGVVAVLIIGTATTPAQATFANPFSLSFPSFGDHIRFPQVVADAEGEAIVVWERPGGAIEADLVPLDVGAVGGGISHLDIGCGPWLSSCGARPARSPQLAGDTDGDTHVVWERFDGANWRIQTRRISSRRPPGGRVGSVCCTARLVLGQRTLSGAGRDAHNPQVATDADGDAVVVWERFRGTYWRIEARTVSRLGALGPVTTLSPPGGDAHAPQVASDGDGGAIVAWQGPRSSATGTTPIQARSISAAGRGPLVDLSEPGFDGTGVELASDAGGNAIAVWQRAGKIEARTFSGRPPVLGPIRELTGPGGPPAFQPKVASDPDGDAIAVWQTNLTAIETRRMSAGGVLGPLRTLSVPGDPWPNGTVSNPQIAIDADGDAVAVWLNGGAIISEQSVQARTISAGDDLGALQNVSRPGQPGVDLPQVAVSPDGRALAVWRGFSDASMTVERLLASRGP